MNGMILYPTDDEMKKIEYAKLRKKHIRLVLSLGELTEFEQWLLSEKIRDEQIVFRNKWKLPSLLINETVLG